MTVESTRPPSLPADWETCTRVLEELGTRPEAFLAKGTPEFAALCRVRAAANRLIDGVQRAVRVQRGQPPDGRPRTASAVQTSSSIRTPVPAAPRPSAEEHTAPVLAGAIEPERTCYVCKQRFQVPHAFYGWMCVECGNFNQEQRHRTANLTGRRALVTGGRIRIGLHTVLKLLRSGAEVVVSTRFPRLAAQRYAEEPDFAEWSDQLSIWGLDLRDLSASRAFALAVGDARPLDILVNNAAQTVWRPAAYYAQLVQAEANASMSGAALSCLSTQDPHRGMDLGRLSQIAAAPRRIAPLTTTAGEAELALSAQLTQVPLHPADLLPTLPGELPSVLDRDGEPLDVRRQNSWSERIDDVAPIELLEVQYVNSIAPFLLTQWLLSALRRSSFERRFIVNVAAQEGWFGRPRPADRHPHTNMAKAALNMLTRTIGPQLAREGIVVSSVDPGWISDQRPTSGDPAELPLDAVDGAARILAPVWNGVTQPDPPRCGVLWKDYRVVPW